MRLANPRLKARFKVGSKARPTVLVGDFQSPRISFIWVTLAQIVCTLPHLLNVPFWVIVLCCICVFWRVMVFQGRWRYPKKYWRYSFVILSIFFLMLYFPVILSIEAAVSLLIITYYMKLLEMFRLKDIYVILVLSYFVIASAFLFREDIVMLVYFCASFVLTTVALVSANRTESKLKSGGNFRLGVTLCLQALPIGLCLFVFFPRFGPFWSLDVQNGGPSVGISDTMSPADIAELGATEGVAFRVEFEGAQPSIQDLYWRVLTLTDFDGQQWRSIFSDLQAQLYFSDPQLQSSLRSLVQPGQKVFDYRISLEPTEQQWLPTLDTPMSVSEKTLVMPDYSRMVNAPITSPKSYYARSSIDSTVDSQINPWLADRSLQLPRGFNPLARQFAIDEFGRVNGDKKLFISNMMNLFLESEFFYTLKPGTYGTHMIDEFLFERRKGFCAHYASSLAFLLRVVGIPSRVVIGYHGGELNKLGGHMVINQYDAHAWVEAWHADEGWVRLDPTAMVVPWRVLIGVEEMMRQSSNSEVPSLQGSLLRNNVVGNGLRQFVDFANYRWSKYVVNFDQDTQRNLMEKAFDEPSLTKLISLMVMSIGAVLCAIALALLWQTRDRNRSQEDRILFKVLGVLGQKYGVRQPAQTLEQYYHVIETKAKQQELASFKRVIELYQRLVYQPQNDANTKIIRKAFQRESHRLIRQLKHIFG